MLKSTDPRFICALEFADKHLGNDNMINLIKACYEVIPSELKKIGKVSNPWPNIDAISGTLLNHYGLT